MKFPLFAILYMSLTPLVGMTQSFAAGLLLGLSWIALFLVQAPTTFWLLQANLQMRSKIIIATMINIILVFLLDLTFVKILGNDYLPLQLYVRLLALNPLFSLYSLKEDSSQSFGETFVLLMKTAFLLFLAALLSGLLREVLGQAQITPWLGVPAMTWNELHPWMPRFLSGPVGGFLFLSLVGWIFSKNWETIWAVRPSRSTIKKQPETQFQKAVLPPSSPQPPLPPHQPVPVEEEPQIPPTPLETSSPPEDLPPPSSDLPWGESEEAILSALVRQRIFDKKRILVIGCGTGESVYELAIKLLVLNRERSQANFRIRGIDTFQTRIEAAKDGIYRESQFSELTQELKSRYLLRYKHEEAKLVKVSQEPRQYVEFMNADFLSPQIYFQKPADLIIINTELDFLPLPKIITLFAQIRSNLRNEGAVILKKDVNREAWSLGWKRTGAKVLRKQR